MRSLEELIVKWHDRSLTAEERAELNAWLSTTEGRARLREEFAFDAALVEALQAEKARVSAEEQARAFETIEVCRGQVFEQSLWRKWLAVFRPLARPRWALALSATACALAFGAVFLLKVNEETLARLDGETTGVTVLRRGKSITPALAFGVKSGDQIETSANAVVAVVYPKETTRLELQPAAQLRVEQTNESKRLELLRGTLTAKIAPQPKGQPMIVTTPHAEARVMGTEFLLSVDAQSSRLEVLEGTVQFVNRDDGELVLVNGGFFATAAKGVEFAARSLVPEPWHSQDIGEVGLAGFARLDGGRCTAKGAGRNTCNTKDQFHFVYQTLDGDGEIVARVVNLELTRPGAKAGVVLRGSLRTEAPHAFLFLRAGGGAEFERRPAFESRSESVGSDAPPLWLRLTRKADVITAFKSIDGRQWVKAGAERIKMGKRIYAGLGVTSWDNAALATSIFDNVTVLPARSSATNAGK